MFGAGLVALLAANSFAGSISTAGITAAPDGGAATPNVSAIYYNPAAIAAVPGFEAMLDVQLTWVGIDATSTRNGGIDPNTGKKYATSTARVMVPNGVIGATGQVIPDRLTLGFAVYEPFVGGGDYTSTEKGKVPPYTGPQRYHIIDTKIITIALTPAVGLTLVEGLHIGGSFSYVMDSLSVYQASDPLGTEGVLPEQLDSDVPSDPYALDTYLSGKTKGSHITAAGGVFFNKFDVAQVGISYSSGGTMKVAGDGKVEVNENLSTEPGGVVVPAQISVEMPLPAVARLYFRSEPNEKLELGAGVDWQLWNVCCGQPEGDTKISLISKDDAGKQDESIGPDDGVTITIGADQYSPRRLWNSMNFVVMGGYQVAEPLWLGLRLGYNQNAVPDYAVNPSNLDFANIPMSLGARYTVGPVTMGLAYSKFLLMKREIKDSAFDLRDGNERFSPELPYKAGANGTYSGRADSLGVRVGLNF
jgi:long-subunit fatty acid transport protein